MADPLLGLSALIRLFLRLFREELEPLIYFQFVKIFLFNLNNHNPPYLDWRATILAVVMTRSRLALEGTLVRPWPGFTGGWGAGGAGWCWW